MFVFLCLWSGQLWGLGGVLKPRAAQSQDFTGAMVWTCLGQHLEGRGQTRTQGGVVTRARRAKRSGERGGTLAQELRVREFCDH